MQRILKYSKGTRKEILEEFINSIRYHDLDFESEITDLSLKIDESVRIANDISGAYKLLSFLNLQEVRIVINSATPLRNLKSLVAERSWSCFVNEISGAPVNKQDAIKSWLNRWEIHPPEVVFIGDGDDDKQSAKEVGCHFIRIQCKDAQNSSEPRYADLDELYYDYVKS